MEHDRATYISSRHLVEVNGVEMHIRCEGEGSPTVVFESGAGTPYLNWWEVQEAIVQDVRTCLYDRQNIGWSEYTGIIPNPKFVAETLHTLLESAGESAPYLLVGHSMGGVYLREYAEQYPDEIFGMVLIDSSHEQQMVRFPQEYLALVDSQSPILTVCQLLSPTGILRILNLGSQDSTYAETTPIYAENLAIFNQSQFCTGVSLDLAGIRTLDTSTPLTSLGDMPLAVLTAGVPISDGAESLPSDLSLETLQEVDQVWLELQEALAGLSTNSSWTVIEDATHYIHLDQPQVVIDAIRDILAQDTDAQ